MPSNAGAPGYALRIVTPSSAVRPGIGRAHARGEVHHRADARRVEAGQLGHRHRGADRAPRAVGVDVRPQRRRAAEPRADLVAGDDALEQPPPVGAELLGHRERARNDVDRRVAAAEPAALVHLERDPRGGVHNVARSGSALPAMAEQRRAAARRAPLAHAARARRSRAGAARHHRAERVEQHELRGRHRDVAAGARRQPAPRRKPRAGRDSLTASRALRRRRPRSAPPGPCARGTGRSPASARAGPG